ncbi:uncharacterized protein LOC144154916 [Haemaphysalis longicornis]
MNKQHRLVRSDHQSSAFVGAHTMLIGKISTPEGGHAVRHRFYYTPGKNATDSPVQKSKRSRIDAFFLPLRKRSSTPSKSSFPTASAASAADKLAPTDLQLVPSVDDSSGGRRKRSRSGSFAVRDKKNDSAPTNLAVQLHSLLLPFRPCARVPQAVRRVGPLSQSQRHLQKTVCK